MWMASCGHLRAGETVFARCIALNPAFLLKGLIERIGIKSVELIEADNTLRKYTREGLEEIARHYRAEARKMNK